MATALALLNVEKDKVHDIAENLSETEGITKVFTVSGRYNIAALIVVKDNEQLEELLTNHMSKEKGIVYSETFISSRVYSQDDMKKMFCVGME